MTSPRARAVRRPRRGMVLDADRAVVLDQHARGMRAGLHHQIGALPCGMQIRLRRAPAAPVAGGGLVVAAAFLLRAVEVRIARNAGLHARLQHRVGQFESGQADRTRAAARRRRGTRRRRGLVLGLLEVRQNGIPVPALAAALAPFVVVAVMAAHIHHAVDRAGAAERLAARQIEPAVGELRLRLGLELPVHRRIDIGLGEPERDMDPRIAVGWTGFQQQHAVAAGLRQTRGDHTAGTTRAGDDEVVGVRFLGHSHPSWIPSVKDRRL